MMKTTITILNLVTVGILISGIFSITSKNPIISIIFLISTFVLAAIYLILMGIKFIGISYIVVYVGAIAVLFLFVIMMINIKLTDIIEKGNQYTKNLPLAVLISALFINIIFLLIPVNYFTNFSLNQQYLFILESKEIYNIINSMNSLSTNIDYLNLLSNLDTNINLLDLNSANFDLTSNLITKFLSLSQIEILGHRLYTEDSILLIILSFILLLAMFAIIIISFKQFK